MHAYQLVGGILILILLKKLFDYRNAATANGNSDATSSSSATQGDDSSSSSFPSSGCDYEVFLSFRGDDTRKTFTDHLYNALVNRGIRTFRDNEGLRIGENIDPVLRSAIHQSKIAIPIFSKDYASSKWCLRELAEIVECMKKQGQRQITVMPVFYHVDPSEVRHQIGCYKKAFQNHQRKFDQETEGWKKALKQVADLKGWDLKNIANGHEGKLIELIIKEVWSDLRKSPLIVSDNLVGIHSHVEEMRKCLNIGSDNDIWIVGILGLGGIGKTTIARCVYNTIHHQFEECSFLANARETFQTRGHVHLQCQLLINILNLENPNITNVDQGIDMIKQRLSNKKVLIVVDDVDENTDLNVIIGKRGWFGIGSRIIITTRDRSILDVLGVDSIYEPNEMDSNQSLLLFSKHAFKRDQPPEQYLDLSKDMIKIAGGLPLALEVLGSFLVGKGESAWKDAVKKLKKIPNHKVLGKLRISYEGLDRVEKEMFLDIACFFIGINKDIACYIWDGCGFFPGIGIEVLHQKSLIKIGEKNELRMHDQLRDLGREIVFQENLTNPGKRSRLWSRSMVLDVLNSQRGTSKVEGLSIEFGFCRDGQCLMSEGFASMTKLRLLKANYARVAGNFVHSFSELRWLSWKGCPIQFTPTNLRKLVVLDLSFSHITENWMGWNYIKEAETLKVLNLSWCDQLSRTPNFSGNLHLEILILEHCAKLVTIDESIGHLKRLVSLNMNWCCSLRCLPTSICELSSLKRLDMESTNIGRFPEKLGCLEALREFKVSTLNALWSANSERIWGILNTKCAERLPNSERIWRNLKTPCAEWLPNSERIWGILKASYAESSECIWRNLKTPSAERLPNSERIWRNLKTPCAEWLPNSIGNWRNLKTFSAEYCNIEEGETLDAIGSLSSLEFLSLKGNPFHTLPATVSALSLLQTLSVAECYNLQSLPSLSHLTNLEVLRLDGCENLAEIPTTIDSLTRLKSLDLRSCHALQYIPVLPSGLTNLDVDECENLTEISASFSNLRNLVQLCVNRCPRLAKIESLEGLYSLEKFIIRNCYSLRKIPKLSCSKNLVCIEIRDCHELSEIEGLEEGLDSLKRLIVCQCPSLRIIPNLSYSKNLVHIEIQGCCELSEIEELKGLYSLEKLIIKCCDSLRKIPNLSDSKNLVWIEISSCDELSEIEGLNGLDSLEELQLHISQCHSLTKIHLPKKLSKLVIRFCPKLAEIEFSLLHVESIIRLPYLSNLKTLKHLQVSGLKMLLGFPSVDKLESLETLEVASCTSIERLPDLSNLTKLGELYISYCDKLIEIQGVDRLENLKMLCIDGCISIETLPCLSNSRNLWNLSVTNCKKLTEIKGVDKLESLTDLCIDGCISIEALPCLSNLKKLQNLSTVDCKKLTKIQGMDKLESLKKLIIRGCISMKLEAFDYRNYNEWVIILGP